MHQEHPRLTSPVLQPDEIAGVALLEPDDRTAEAGGGVLDDQIAIRGDLRGTRLRPTGLGEHIASVAVIHRTPPSLDRSSRDHAAAMDRSGGAHTVCPAGPPAGLPRPAPTGLAGILAS